MSQIWHDNSNQPVKLIFSPLVSINWLSEKSSEFALMDEFECKLWEV